MIHLDLVTMETRVECKIRDLLPEVFPETCKGRALVKVKLKD